MKNTRQLACHWVPATRAGNTHRSARKEYIRTTAVPNMLPRARDFCIPTLVPTSVLTVRGVRTKARSHLPHRLSISARGGTLRAERGDSQMYTLVPTGTVDICPDKPQRGRNRTLPPSCSTARHTPPIEPLGTGVRGRYSVPEARGCRHAFISSQ